MMKKVTPILIATYLITPTAFAGGGIMNVIGKNQNTIIQGLGIIQQTRGEIAEFKDSRADCQVTSDDQDAIINLAHEYNMHLKANDTEINPQKEFSLKDECSEGIGLKEVLTKSASTNKAAYKTNIRNIVTKLQKCWSDDLTKEDQKKIAKVQGNCNMETIGAFSGIGERLMQGDSPLGNLIAPMMGGGTGEQLQGTMQMINGITGGGQTEE